VTPSADLTTLTGDETLELPEFDVPPADPLALAAAWFAAAVATGVREPGAVALATASADGIPSSRTVSLKQITAGGAIFSTSDASRKASELRANPHASLTLYWRETLQQLTLRGTVEVLPDEASDALFADRPRGAQVASIVSTPGAALADEAAFAAHAAEVAAHPGALARPETWRGYLLVPTAIEFWHGRSDRLHRRLSYERVDGAWVARRVQP